MAGRVEGKVAFVTGAARGQGRSHALRLAQEGADIIAIDIVGPIDTAPYALSTPDDLAETARQIKALGRRVVATEADVRDFEAVKSALDAGVTQLGKLDVAVANAGICGYGALEELSGQQWQDMLDVNLTGVWHTVKAAVPHLRANSGGSVILTSSIAGLNGVPNIGHYAAAKHGCVGLMRTAGLELANDNIRVNCVHPTTVNTDMAHNSAAYALFAPDLAPEQRTRDAVAPRFATLNAMPIPWVEPADISNAVLFLASDEARYITGVTLPVDAGSNLKN